MRINNFNRAAIVAAQKAYADCQCPACMRPAGEPITAQCEAERALWSALDRGEDQYIAAVGAK